MYCVLAIALTRLAAQRLQQHLAFLFVQKALQVGRQRGGEVVETDGFGVGVVGLAGRGDAGAAGVLKIRQGEAVAVAQRERALQQVLQLAHVARPVVAAQQVENAQFLHRFRHDWVLRLSAALCMAAVAGVALLTAHGDARLVMRTVTDFIPTALSLIGAATLIAAAIERGLIKTDNLRRWKVSELPRMSNGKGLFVRSRFDGLFELVATGLFIGWWTGVISFPFGPVIHSGHGDAVLAISPVFQQLYWPILALAILQIADLVLDLLFRRPRADQSGRAA